MGRVEKDKSMRTVRSSRWYMSGTLPRIREYVVSKSFGRFLSSSRILAGFKHFRTSASWQIAQRNLQGGLACGGGKDRIRLRSTSVLHKLLFNLVFYALLPSIKLGIGHHLRSDVKADVFICQSSRNIDINIANCIHGLFDIHFGPTRDKDAQIGSHEGLDFGQTSKHLFALMVFRLWAFI